MRDVGLSCASNPASASLTACDVGNALAFAGERSTTDVPFATSAWNFPRSNLAKSERLYSDRISSLAFFINFPFAARHALCTEKSNSTRSVRVADRERAAKAGMTERDKPDCADRMVWIRAGNGQRIEEDRRRFVKRNSVLSKIGLRFPRIPLKLHRLKPLIPSRITFCCAAGQDGS